MIKAKTNHKEWQKAMNLWLKASRNKSHADCVNYFGKWSLINAIKKTPKAKLGKFPFNATANPDKGGKTYKQRFFYAMAAKMGATGDEVKPLAEKLYKRKRASAGVMKAGFVKPLKAFAGYNKTRVFSRGSASRSKGVNAKGGGTFNKLTAKSLNAVPGSGKVAYIPMQLAKRETVIRQKSWAINRLQKANNKFSSKKY